jgi:hypothetical protein
MEPRRRKMQVRGESAGSPALHDTSRPSETESGFVTQTQGSGTDWTGHTIPQL